MDRRLPAVLLIPSIIILLLWACSEHNVLIHTGVDSCCGGAVVILRLLGLVEFEVNQSCGNNIFVNWNSIVYIGVHAIRIHTEAIIV